MDVYGKDEEKGIAYSRGELNLNTTLSRKEPISRRLIASLTVVVPK